MVLKKKMIFYSKLYNFSMFKFKENWHFPLNVNGAQRIQETYPYPFAPHFLRYFSITEYNRFNACVF